MAIEIKKIYEKIHTFDVKLLAGEGGMNRYARWYHTVESLEISTFLTGNEIVFTTGVAMKNSKDLFELIKSVHEHHASAMVINLGPYIESVSDLITDFCNKNDFPLFVVPWHIHMADIMRCISTLLSESEIATDNSELSKALTKAVTEPEKEEQYQPTLVSLGFGINNTLQVAIAENDGADLPVPPHGCSVVKLNIIGKNVFVLCGFDRNELRKFCTACSKNGVILCVGRSVDIVSLLYKSYSNALMVFAARKVLPDSQKGLIFEDTGVYGLAMSFNDMSVTDIFYQETIGVLHRYDDANKSDCCKALRAYLMNNCSIKAASNETGIHKNTLLNRIHKVEELLDGDMSDMLFKCRLTMAFVIEDLMQKK